MHDSLLLNIRTLAYLLKLLELHICTYKLSGQGGDKIWTFVAFLCNLIQEMYVKSKMLLKYEVITSKIPKAINQETPN